VNQAPVGPESRLTDERRARRKRPYRPHQRSSELVATLDAASDKEAVFLYIVGFFEDRGALRFSFVGMAGALFYLCDYHQKSDLFIVFAPTINNLINFFDFRPTKNLYATYVF
ncbi:MAG: hypothetical protein IJD60_00775, partial [Clostridia bacterium]|nr:hypothetical protein [Clostridia bacterium]